MEIHEIRTTTVVKALATEAHLMCLQETTLSVSIKQFPL